MTESSKVLIANGILVKVRLLTTKGAPLSQQQLSEILAQNTTGQNNNLQQDLVANPLLEGNHNINSNSNPLSEAGPPFFHGFIVIAMQENWPEDLYGGVGHSGQAFLSNDCSDVSKGGITAKADEIEEAPTKLIERLPVKRERKVVLLKVDAVDWISSGRNHVTLHSSQESYRLRESLDSIELRLPADKFVRISRSKIVQIDRIKEFDVRASGDCQVLLEDGTNLNLSRRYRVNLQKRGLLWCSSGTAPRAENAKRRNIL